MVSKSLWIIPVLSVFLALGCTPAAKVKDTGGASVEDRSGQAGADGASATGLPGSDGMQANPMDDPANPLSKRIIYFDYDRSEIRPEYQEIILAHGAYLAGHPDTVVVLEGNTDERGSREYNIALGDRRAQSVRRLLLFQGAADKQIEVVSYGEEKPVAEGHDEAAWAQNRRVELVYKR